MDEINQLRGFSLEVLDFCGVEVSAQALEPVLTSNSLQGFREAANDMVEMCQDLSDQQVVDLDSKLQVKGLPTLTMMRDSRYKHFLKILSREQITSDDEFRLVNSIVSDTASPFLSENSRSAAEALLANYEARL